MSWLAFRLAAGGFLKSPTGKIAMLAVFVVALVLGFALTGRDHGMRTERARWLAKEAIYTKAAAALDRQTNAIAVGLRAVLEAKTAAIETRTITIRERIPRYVTAKSDRDTPIPVGFVRVFNASAEGSELPAAPSGPVEAPSGVALSAVADVAAQNHAAALSSIAENEAWREWYIRERAAWEKAGLRGALPVNRCCEVCPPAF